MSEKLIRYSVGFSLVSFAFCFYLMFSSKSLFPYIILCFLVPFSVISYKHAEAGFIMLFLFVVSVIVAVKIYGAVYIADSVVFALSVLLFYFLKNHLEKQSDERKDKIVHRIEELKKEISDVEGMLQFYATYKKTMEDSTQKKRFLISFIKDVENSMNEDEVVLKTTKAIKMIYKEVDVIFITSPGISKPVEDLFQAKTSIYIPSTSSDTRYPKTVWGSIEKSVVILPVIVFSRVIAAIKISSPKENYISKDDFMMLEIIARVCATVFENIYLYRTTEELARKDSLTGVFTRRMFDEKIDEEILVSARTSQPFSLLIIDIDHFKKINDTYGHQIGDIVLRDVAKTIKQNLREFDFVARYGGEEFAVIMPNTSKEDAIKIAHRISSEVKKLTFSYNDKFFSVSLSGGLGEFPREGTSKAQIIRRCDERLYSAKRSGRDKIVYE